jgi:hypothetical protein
METEKRPEIKPWLRRVVEAAGALDGRRKKPLI